MAAPLMLPYARKGLFTIALAPAAFPAAKRMFTSSSALKFSNKNNDVPVNVNNNNNANSNTNQQQRSSRPAENDRGAPVTVSDTLAWTSAKLVFGAYDFWNRKTSLDGVDALRRIRFTKSFTASTAFSGTMARQVWSFILGERNDIELTKFLANEFNYERMHLLHAFDLANSSFVVRMASLAVQFVVGRWLAFAYFLSPRFVHRFLGHINYDAARSYERILQDSTGTQLTARAAKVDRDFWSLKEDATVTDLITALGSDSEKRRLLHHQLADENAGIGSLGTSIRR